MVLGSLREVCGCGMVVVVLQASLRIQLRLKLSNVPKAVLKKLLQPLSEMGGRLVGGQVGHMMNWK